MSDNPRVTPGPGVRAISVSDGSLTGTVVLSEGANITIGTGPGNAVVISGGAGGGAGGSFSAGVSTGGNTSGSTGTVSNRIVFAGGNNITLSQSTAAAGATVTISAPNAVAQTGTQFSGGISGGNTAGDTGTKPGQMVLAGGNNVTVSGATAGDNISITISGPNTAAQTGTQFSAGISTGGNTAGDTGVKAARLVLAGGNRVTVSGSTNGESVTVTISGAADGAGSVSTATTASSVTSANVVGADAGRYALEGHQHAGVGPAGVSNVGNTAGDTGALQGRLVLAGGNKVTLSVSSSNNNAQTVTISAADQTGTQFSAGISTGGNTSGDTGVKAARLVLAGGNNITLSGSSNGESVTVTVSAPNLGAGGNFSGGVSNLGNTAGSTGITGTRLVFVGTDNVTLSQSTDANGGTVTVKAGPTLNYTRVPESGAYDQYPIPNAQMQIQPLFMDGYLTATIFDTPISMSSTQSASSAQASWAVSVYTYNSGTASLATSASSSTSWTSGTGNSSNWGGVMGGRQWQITNQTFQFTPGHYVVGVWHRSSNAGTYQWLGPRNQAGLSGVLGSNSATNAQLQAWLGVYSATTAGGINSIRLTADVDGFAGGNIRVAGFQFKASSHP